MCFWTDNWVGEFLYELDSADSLTCLCIENVRWLSWRRWDGRKEGVYGCVVVVLWCGRRRVWGSVDPRCITLFCRIILMIVGGGCLNLLGAIQCVALTAFWQLLMRFQVGVVGMTFGISSFRPKCLSSRGVCLIRNRIPTKMNLLHRRVLHPNNILCVGGCGCTEMEDHLFLGCILFGNVWMFLWRWLDIDFVPSGTIGEHLSSLFIWQVCLDLLTHFLR